MYFNLIYWTVVDLKLWCATLRKFLRKYFSVKWFFITQKNKPINEYLVAKYSLNQYFLIKYRFSFLAKTKHDKLLSNPKGHTSVLGAFKSICSKTLVWLWLVFLYWLYSENAYFPLHQLRYKYFYFPNLSAKYLLYSNSKYWKLPGFSGESGPKITELSVYLL